MNRLHTLLIISTFSFVLSACAAHPQPHPALHSLYSVTTNTYKDSLQQEILRLCGHTKNNETPKSCQLDNVSAPVIFHEGTAHEIFMQSEKFPQESMPIITAQFLDQAAQANFTLPLSDTPVSLTDSHDADIFRKSLAYEYGIVFALKTAQAFLDDDSLTAIEKLRTHHEEIIRILVTSLRDVPPVPQPESGYNFTTQHQPTDPNQAHAFVEEIHHNSIDWWASVVSQVNSPQNRAFPLLVAHILKNT